MLLLLRSLVNPVVKSSPRHYHRGLVTGKPLFKSRSSAAAIKQSSSSSPRDGLALYCKMHRQSFFKVDSFDVLSALKSAASSNDPIIVRHFHGHVVRLGFVSNVYVVTCLLSAYVATSFRDARLLFDEMPDRTAVTWNVMVTGYARSGDVDKAREVFEEMPQRNVESWSAMIAAYVHSGSWVRGLSLFREMMMVVGNDGLLVKPDKIALSTVLSCCSQMGSPGSVLGRSVHGYLLKMNVENDTVLVDMYAKCGVFKYACLVFSSMKEKNVMVWTALICGAARHGCSEEALSVFEMMKEEGVRPNEPTFTGILHACAHSGMVGTGRRYFNMIEEYGLEYKIQHYGCMVDLYGRAGLVEEAYEVIERMKLAPNAAVWGSFLSACKEHDRFDMADKVIEQVLVVVKPETDGGVYTQICDLYVLNEKWEDAERVRKLMLNHNVRKVRGSSFVRSRVDRGYS